MGITKQDAIDACYDVVHGQKELGRLVAFVDGLPDETLAILRGGSSNEAIVEFPSSWWPMCSQIGQLLACSLLGPAYSTWLGALLTVLYSRQAGSQAGGPQRGVP